MSFSDHNLFVVRRRRRRRFCCRKPFHIFFFSRITLPISAKLGTKHPWVMGIQGCSNHLNNLEGPRPFPRGDNNERVKIC